MSILGRWISEQTPKFNKEIVEGFSYHRLKGAVKYIDDYIQYVSKKRTKTKLDYLGYRIVPPEEEVALKFKGGGSRPYDLAEDGLYLVEYSFRYADEEKIRKHLIYLPHLEPGNKLMLGSKEWLIMPTLADKVISIGERQIFIYVNSAKHTFVRTIHTVSENGLYRNVPVVMGDIYRNPVKKLDDTTNAKSTIIHYLLAYYGYSKTMELILGWVPQPVYDVGDRTGKVVFESTGLAPDGFKGDPREYKKNRIKFIINEEDNTPEVIYCVGNVLYVLDNFSERLSIEQMEDPIVWRRFMGEIIFSGNHGLHFIMDKMYRHFSGLDYPFDADINHKLKDIGIEADNLIELLATIFRNFNTWLATGDDRNLYNTKSMEVETYALSKITFMFTKLYLDINKEELALEPGQKLVTEEVDKAFRAHMRERSIFHLKKEILYVSSVEDATDHLYFKQTAFLSKQESNSINAAAGGSNTSARHKLSATMATIGSILYLSKRNPDPCIRQNPYASVDFKSGTILPDPMVGDIVTKTDKLLAETYVTNNVKDISEEDDYDVDFDEDFEDFEDNSDTWEDYDD